MDFLIWKYWDKNVLSSKKVIFFTYSHEEKKKIFNKKFEKNSRARR